VRQTLYLNFVLSKGTCFTRHFPRHVQYDKTSATDPSPIKRSRSIDQYNGCRVHTAKPQVKVWSLLCSCTSLYSQLLLENIYRL